MNYDEIAAEIAERNPDAKFADGLEDALVGYAVSEGRTLALYSSDRVIKILMRRDNMTVDDAIEFFEFNVAGSYIGPNTPMFHDFRWYREFSEDPPPDPDHRVGDAERAS